MIVAISTSILIGALLVGILLLLWKLRQAQRSAAALQRETQGGKALLEHELVALRQSLEQRLAARTLELEQVKRELDDLSYSVSHDLSAPARKISGFAELLGEEAAALSDEGRQWLARILHNSRDINAMLSELLRLSRIGRAALDLRTVELAPLAAEAVRSAGADYPGTQVHVAPLPAIRCDPGLMLQLFQILAANAFKFSGKGVAPRIEIGVQPEAEGLRFFVRDNGAGFNMRHTGKLFVMFQRLHKESDFPGMGAGLAIARKIVQRHDGRIWAEGVEGEGASFYFTLGGGDGAG